MRDRDFAGREMLVQGEAPRTVPLSYVVVGGVIALALIGWLLWTRGDEVAPPAIEPAATTPPDLPVDADDTEAAAAAAAREREQRIESWTRFTGTAPTWPDDFAAPRECAEVEEAWTRVCRALDSRDYIQARIRNGGACTLARDVAEALAADTPVLESELKSYPALLSNVFHLFRVLGRSRLILLREIADSEQEHQEEIALALYRWLASRERCAQDAAANVGTDTLYEYAGFLTQTMGGQAYLRRRPPATEALASFYALVALDAADQAGINSHGIDPRPEMARCRELVQDVPLVFRDRYLRELDAMEARWRSRSAGSP